ncbi:outer membrane beta-barrel family protein [Foetidibacter luteolus]|uniref:outer membrane beta-barrel family protein n=1 Tax=Foetidibacter luteolus TaxID=2608880 RepID=UPI001A9A2B9D|nr:outer membrane beta-barrel family protein [Foetidibacter luteolus]
MKLICTLVLIAASFNMLYAQAPQGRRPGGRQNMNIGHFYGKVVDGKTNKGIDGVSVVLVGNRFDTATKKMKESILATVISQPNGDFSIENLPVFGKFRLKASAIGYTDLDQQVSFDLKMPQEGGGQGDGGDRMQQMMGAIDKDLGNLKLVQNDATLANVTVTATKPFFEMGVDRKIFNVDKNIVSSGQTGAELMKQIPSLNVDIDGNVTLRNAAPTLFVDGRPTTLTLDQIPADIIEKVELITNPSAKYDASGGNAGILNIILKKNKKVGYNGGIRAGIDSRARINTGLDLNVRQNKLNFFASANFNQRKSKSWGYTDRNNFSNPASNVYQDSKGENDGYFGFLRGGFDYFMDNRNTISVSANYNRGKFDSEEDQIIDSTVDNSLLTNSRRNTFSKRNFKNFGSQLSYKHNFAKTGHDLSADVNYNSSNNDNEGTYTTNFFNESNSSKYPSLIQKVDGSGYNKFLTIQGDYENPLTENSKLEAGVRTAIRDFQSDNNQYTFDHATQTYVLSGSLSNRYKFKDQVYAAYATYSLKTKKWSYQLGLRAESSSYDGTLLGKDSAFKVDFPLSLFPSAFITYKIDDKQDFQANYSRRINRPNFFQLLPFIDNSDPLNLSIGNPGLKPEFTNSFELNYNNAYTKGANFLASLFFKHSTDLITNYIYKAGNPDTSIVKADSVFFSTYVNASSSMSYGLELTNRITVYKIWDMTMNVNIFNSKINGDNITGNLSQQRWSWFVKMNNNVKLGKGFSVQLSADYQAKTVLPQSGGGGGRRGGGGGGGGGFFGGPVSSAQGYVFPRYSFDIAIRKDFTWKGGNTASIILSMNDFTRAQVYKTYSESEFFNQVSQRRRDPQVARLIFNYRFGKFDANLFKRKNTRADQSGGSDMMGQ